MEGPGRELRPFSSARGGWISRSPLLYCQDPALANREGGARLRTYLPQSLGVWRMTKKDKSSYDLKAIARQAMLDRGLEPDFKSDVIRELSKIEEAAKSGRGSVRDLRDLLWCSIDNDDSEDLDQITYAEEVSGGATRVLVGIADVDSLVHKGSAIDGHAEKNTTSVYTGVTIFPMLPNRLSTDLTSLSEGTERMAMIVDMTVDDGGAVGESDVYRAAVVNKAKLAYDSVSEGLDGNGAGKMPGKVRQVAGLERQLRLQDEAAQKMRALRHSHGALEFETIEPRALIKEGEVVDLVRFPKNRARELIEDFMIGANGATARFLEKKGRASIRRVVRSPKRWPRIVQKAAELNYTLPENPDSKALADFLRVRRRADPVTFPDLSLTIVKLMGAGEYVLELPGQVSPGHFGLAVRDYAHSTAPNRRYPDLILQRLLKAAIDGADAPYGNDELEWLAQHCTKQEDAADKVERQVRKSASALLIRDRVGDYFDGIVTGASAKGTWARVFSPPVEGKVVHNWEGLDVGDRVRLKLIDVDIPKGYIDFVRTSG
jgi:VacB/RNase II family 3'-5' exoribonuclease